MSIINACIVELSRHNEYVAKGEEPIPARMMEYLTEYTRWHSHSRHSSQVITVKDVTRLNIKSDENTENLYEFQILL